MNEYYSSNGHLASQSTSHHHSFTQSHSHCGPPALADPHGSQWLVDSLILANIVGRWSLLGSVRPEATERTAKREGMKKNRYKEWLKSRLNGYLMATRAVQEY